MKKSVLFLMILAASAALAQEPQSNIPEKFSSNLVVRPAAPTATDLYCSGFVSKEEFPRTNFVAGSKVVPNAARFVSKDTLFLTGQGYEVGKTYRLIRRVKDRNGTENFDGQTALLKASGSTWDDIGRAKVTHLVNGFAVAQMEFSCQDAQEGDLAIPFEQKSAPAFSHNPKDFQQFGVPESSVTGQIVSAFGFDYLVGTRSRVYVNLGKNHNLQVGDYLRITRGNSEGELSPVEAVSGKATIVDETTDNMPRASRGAVDDFPRRGLGEIMVIDVHPETATGIVTVALEDIHLGDRVEVENAPAATGQTSGASKTAHKWYKMK
jgi:hypothetical protein